MNLQPLLIPNATIHKYKRYLPTAFDESLTLLEKVNKIIEFLNTVINVTNDNTLKFDKLERETNEKVQNLVNQFTDLRDWLEGEGLEENTSNVLDEWFQNGKLEAIINENVFNMKADKSEVDALSSQLAQIAHSDLSKFSGSDTERLNTFLSSYGGQSVRIPRGTYTITNTLVIPKDTEVIAEGVKLKSASHIPVLRLNSGVKIRGFEIEGVGNQSFNPNGNAIEIRGEYNETLQTIQYADNILIEDCYLHSLGSSGVLGEYSRFVQIKNTKIENVGRNGILGNSVENWIVSDKTHIKGISPGSTSTISGGTVAYGIAFSKVCDLGANATEQEINEDLRRYPKSKNCTVENVTVEDNLLWEGLDTHSGENIAFINNTIINCKRGIVATNISRNIDGVIHYYLSPKNITIKGNTILGNKTGEGIVIAGVLGGTQSNPDFANPKEYAEGCQIEGNTLINCGEEGNNISGAIYVRETRGLVIYGNTLKDSLVFGINLYYSNVGFSVIGNTVIDVHDNSWSSPSGIALRAIHNQGIIEGNNTMKVDNTLNTYVSVRGISIIPSTNIDLIIGTNRSTFDTPYYNCTGEKAKYMTFGNGDRHMFTGNGSPEGSIFAKLGSIYINLGGGEGTTYYVKEKGASSGSNTGWVAK